MKSFLKNDLRGAGWEEGLLLLVDSTFRNTIDFDVSGVTYSLANYSSFRVSFLLVINRVICKPNLKLLEKLLKYLS